LDARLITRNAGRNGGLCPPNWLKMAASAVQSSNVAREFPFYPEESLLLQGIRLNNLYPNHPTATASNYNKLILTSPNTIVRSYQGELLNQLPHGIGSCVYKSGYEYEGEYNAGLHHGSGRMKFPDGTIYQGEFFENSITGIGRFIWPNNTEYTGSVLEGFREGYGVYIDNVNNVSYSGEWKNGRKHGQGRLIYSNSNVYQGEFREGNRHGIGRLDYSSGNYYIGTWKYDKKEGEGAMYYISSNELYRGQWRNNLPNGIGEYLWLNIAGLKNRTVNNKLQTHLQQCNRYVGEFVDGARSGYGRCYYSDGAEYAGQWVNNKKHDPAAVFIFSHGFIYRGEFMNDCMQSAVFAETDSSMIDLPIQDLLLHTAKQIVMDNKNNYINLTFQEQLSNQITQEKQFLTNLLLRYNTDLLEMYRFYSNTENNIIEAIDPLSGPVEENLTMSLFQFWSLCLESNIISVDFSLAAVNRLAMKYHENHPHAKHNHNKLYIPTSPHKPIQSIHTGSITLLYRQFAELLIRLANEVPVAATQSIAHNINPTNADVAAANITNANTQQTLTRLLPKLSLQSNATAANNSSPPPCSSALSVRFSLFLPHLLNKFRSRSKVHYPKKQSLNGALVRELSCHPQLLARVESIFSKISKVNPNSLGYNDSTTNLHSLLSLLHQKKLLDNIFTYQHVLSIFNLFIPACNMKFAAAAEASPLSFYDQLYAEWIFFEFAVHLMNVIIYHRVVYDHYNRAQLAALVEAENKKLMQLELEKKAEAEAKEAAEVSLIEESKSSSSSSNKLKKSQSKDKLKGAKLSEKIKNKRLNSRNNSQITGSQQLADYTTDSNTNPSDNTVEPVASVAAPEAEQPIFPPLPNFTQLIPAEDIASHHPIPTYLEQITQFLHKLE
jgi:hypothetical protein